MHRDNRMAIEKVKSYRNSSLERFILELNSPWLNSFCSRLSRSPAFGVAGFRRGRAPARYLYAQHQVRFRQALFAAVDQQLSPELRKELECAVVPPLYLFRPASGKRKAEVEIQVFRRPETPDPRGTLGELGGKAPGSPPVLPRAAQPDFQAYLPQSVQALPHFKDYRLGAPPSTGQSTRLLEHGADRPALPQVVRPMAGPGIQHVLPKQHLPQPAVPEPEKPQVQIPEGVNNDNL
jgi:hypothetical protein